MLAQDTQFITLDVQEKRLLQSLTGEKITVTSQAELNQLVKKALGRINPQHPGACLACCLLKDFLEE